LCGLSRSEAITRQTVRPDDDGTGAIASEGVCLFEQTVEAQSESSYSVRENKHKQENPQVWVRTKY
jgi:hypothetical protein